MESLANFAELKVLDLKVPFEVELDCWCWQFLVQNSGCVGCCFVLQVV